jgi:hypothetical protein
MRPSGSGGVHRVKIRRRHHAQHGVAQKFQPLVAGIALGPVFVGVGAVGQGVDKKALIPEAVAQLFFKLFHSALSSRISPVMLHGVDIVP